MEYLIAAYSAIWLILFIFLFSLFSKQTNLEKTLESLQKRMER
ncbi:MAG: CcmD family protein [Acidobacteria bacterium]|nr:MAG: CcmD family protein [Acidobacteriota bacterium]